MKLIRNLSLGVLLMWWVDGCLSPPNYPIVPQISFNDIYYGKSTKGGLDSIVVSLQFNDGDGDLGLDDSYDANQNFALRYFFTYRDQLTNTDKPVTYKAKRENPTLRGTDGRPLPSFVTPYNCTNWEVQYKIVNKVPVPTDTLYVEFNPNYYNIGVRFFVDGVYFDPAKVFIYPNCQIQGYSGRFPVLSLDPDKKSPLDGKIIYSMKSGAFDLQFSIKQLQLKIAIQDRAFNKSDTILTPKLTLQSIRR